MILSNEKAVVEILKSVQKPIILIHDKPDGDALGSATALALYLCAIKKDCAVVSPCKIPKRLSFVVNDKVKYFEGYENLKESGFIYDSVISVDVASNELVAPITSKIEKSILVAIDHHRINTITAENKFVDESAAATGEIIYSIIDTHNKEEKTNLFTLPICEAIYAAISSDTGCFKYGNTTEKSHNIASKLYKTGVNAERINRLLFDTKTFSQIKTEELAYKKLTMHYDGRLALIDIDISELDAIGATEEDTETISQLARMIEGVQIGVMMREKIFNDGKTGYKFSVRSNIDTDVSLLCSAFGGGGHKKAAGCTVFGQKKLAFEAFLKEAEKYLI